MHNVHVLMLILCDCMDTCWVTTETDIYKNISIIKSLLSFILQLHDCLPYSLTEMLFDARITLHFATYTFA